MKFKVLYNRGEGVYVLEYKGMYYITNLRADGISEPYEYIDSILKFGYFNPTRNSKVPKKYLIEIEERLLYLRRKRCPCE